MSAAIREGRIPEAWEMAIGTGIPLENWPAGEPLCEAARLASFLGAGRLSRVLHWRNWREDKGNARRYCRALHGRMCHAPAIKLLWETRGFMATGKEIPNQDRADLLAFQAAVLVGLADFDEAWKLLDEADLLTPDNAWIRIQRSICCSASDRYEEALEEAMAACRVAPSYHVAVTQCSDALIHLGRDDEALELLERTHRNSPQAAFPLDMQVIFSERGDAQKGLWCLSEVERLSPLMEPSLKKWLTGRRADFHLMAGKLSEYLEIAGGEVNPHVTRIAEKLRRPGAAKGVRKQLDVKFTRQHRMTCAPATLASIAAFWGVERDHFQIAEEICYEGTPWHKERLWADGNGFVTKEFRLTRNDLVSLIDRGVPFTLTTEWTTGAHLQACIGYDTRTDTVILRDPTERHFGERLLDHLISSHPIGGPRAMVMVPADRQDLLGGLLLEDEHVYGSFHRLLLAMDTHDRFKVQVAVSELRAVARDHPLTLDGEIRAARVLQEWPRAMVLTEELMKRFPDHESLWLTKSNLLLNLRRMRDRREFLESVVAGSGADPVFQSDLGELLSEDARELVMAEYHLRRALRHRGQEARVYENLARCRVKQRRFTEAAELRRASTCLAPGFEPYAGNYFETCRMVGRTDEALGYLEKRALRLGGRNHGPWLTHARKLEAINRPMEAAEVLEKAVASHPDDGELLLHGGHLMISWGPDHLRKGMDWMARSHGKVEESEWLRESAEVAGFLGDRPAAIRHWRALMVLQPLDISVWRYLARLLAEDGGRQEANRFFEEGTTRFPEFAGLWGLAAEWLSTEPRGAIQALDQYLRLVPTSAWGYRERALRKLDLKDREAALVDTREALELEPESPVSWHIHSEVLAKSGQREEARAALREALTLDIDRCEAATDLMGLATDRDDSIALIGFIEDEMRRQVSNGEIVPVFQRLAWRWMEPEDLLEKLEGFRGERPDLWQTWSAVITQALRMSLHEKAANTGEAMTAAYPLLPRAWLDLANVQQSSGNLAAEVAATGKALEISPAWDEAARLHADALERAGDLKQAEAVLRKAVLTDPLDPGNRGSLADLLRRMGSKEEAVTTLIEALRISPFYQWGWRQLALWTGKDKRRDEAVALLEEVSEANRHCGTWFSHAADIWMDLERPVDAIRLVREGFSISPEDNGLREKLAWMLCVNREVDEALAICGPRPGEEMVSREIEGRRAWILMRSGHPVQAIQVMRELLEREPDYIWGLSELTGWIANRQDWPGALEMAKRWYRHSPLDRAALGFIGQAEANLGNSAAAANAYKKSLVLDPGYEFGGRQLLDLQMKGKQYDEAAETLAHLRHFSPSVWMECDAVELALLRNDHNGALAQAGTILDREDAGFDVVNWLEDLFTKGENRQSWQKLLDIRLKAGTAVAPGALAVAIGHIPTTTFVKTAYKRVKSEPAGSPQRFEGWKRMLDLAAKLKQSSALVKWARKDALELKGNPILWSEMGGALLSTLEYNRGAEWMADWKERNGEIDETALLRVAALNDGCRSRNSAHRQVAKDARREALRRFPDSRTGSAFRGPLAFQKAVDGDIDGARELLRDFEPDTIADYYANYGRCAEAMVAAADGDEALAKRKLHRALGYFSGVDQAGPKAIAIEATKAVAERIPSARGSVRRLRRQWELPALGRVTRKPFWEKDVTLGRSWIFVLVIVVVKLLHGCDGS